MWRGKQETSSLLGKYEKKTFFFLTSLLVTSPLLIWEPGGLCIYISTSNFMQTPFLRIQCYPWSASWKQSLYAQMGDPEGMLEIIWPVSFLQIRKLSSREVK